MVEPALRADVRKSAASPRRITLRDRFSAYALHHRQVARDSLLRMLRKPLGSLATWLVIGIALALPGGLFVAIDNLEKLGAGWDGAPQISLFLRLDVTDDAARALGDRLARRGDVAQVGVISREQALAEFRQQSGFGNVVDQLEGNPLPAVITLRLPQGKRDASAMQRLFEEVKALPEVERGILDLQWVERLFAILAIGRDMVLALAGMLGLGVVLVVGNTIRLAIESRRDEILVVKLVGGTNAFVRRPFLYTGLWFGLGGGLVAVAILVCSLLWLEGSVAYLAELYDSEYTLTALDAGHVLGLLLSGSLVGWLGSWWAVQRHLGAIEPR
jgi:cell division transport system permease protein